MGSDTGFKTKQLDKRYDRMLNKRADARLCRKDFFIMLAFTLFYFCINLINLGSTQGPQTFWEVTGSRFAPQYAVLCIEGDVPVSDLYIFKSVAAANLRENIVEVYSAQPQEVEGGYLNAVKENNLRCKIPLYDDAASGFDRVFKWYKVPVSLSPGEYAVFLSTGTGSRVMEIALADAAGNSVDFAFVYSSSEGQNSPAAAFDEPHCFTNDQTLMSNMYFDEVFHARTAYEMLSGYRPYEITHPPLGKSIIGWGISVFGMNSFGWRIAVVLFSCMCLPVCYMLGRRLFVGKKGAVFMTLLFALDGLHFVLGRIATLDVIAMFFCLCATLCMTVFFQTNILREKPLKCLLPLAGAGVFFGWATAVKWTGIYMGVGLFVMLVVYVYRMFSEFRHMAAHHGKERYRKAGRLFNKNLAAIIGVCTLFFVVLPFVTYLLSYLPYLYPANAALNIAGEQRSLWQVMWENQQYMLNFHSQAVVGSTHNSQSRWWEWMLNLRSVFFYRGEKGLEQGMYARIHAVGNPAVSYGGLLALTFCAVAAIVKLCKKINRLGKRQTIQSAANIVDNRIATTSTAVLHTACVRSDIPNHTASAGTAIAGSSSVLAKKADSAKNNNAQGNAVIKNHKSKCGIAKDCILSDNNTDKNQVADDALFVLLVGFLAALVPWIFIERPTFIYHYTPAIPFLCGIIVYVFSVINSKGKSITLNLFGKRITTGRAVPFAVLYAVFAGVLFVMLFPLFTGLPLRLEVANILFRWLTGLGSHYGM